MGSMSAQLFFLFRPYCFSWQKFCTARRPRYTRDIIFYKPGFHNFCCVTSSIILFKNVLPFISLTHWYWLWQQIDSQNLLIFFYIYSALTNNFPKPVSLIHPQIIRDAGNLIFRIKQPRSQDDKFPVAHVWVSPKQVSNLNLSFQNIWYHCGKVHSPILTDWFSVDWLIKVFLPKSEIFKFYSILQRLKIYLVEFKSQFLYWTFSCGFKNYFSNSLPPWICNLFCTGSSVSVYNSLKSTQI